MGQPLCEITGWNVYVQTKNAIERMGHGKPVHIMKLKHSHYTLWKCRRVRQMVPTATRQERGGMLMSPTMTPHVVSRHQTQQIECRLESTFPTDIMGITIKARPSDGVLAFRRRLGEVLGCAWERVRLLDSADPRMVLGDECDLCPSMIIRDAWYEVADDDNTYVEFNVDPTGEACVMKCKRATTHQQLLHRLSLLTNLPEASIDLRSVHGEPWHFPASIAQTRVIIQVYRGGMQNQLRERSRSRSVTPTVPFTRGNAATIRAEIITKLILQTIFLCNRDHYITQINSPENFFV